MIGSGGCMRELAWQISECDMGKMQWEICGYVDIDSPATKQGVCVGGRDIPYLGDDSYLGHIHKSTDIIVSVGSPRARRAIVERLEKNPLIRFPNIILGNTHVCKDADIWRGSRGCIVSVDCRVSTNVKMGDFVFMNMGSAVCHDGVIGDFVTLGPDVRLAGAVEVGENTEIGMGAKVIQGIHIGSNAIVGAGSVVVKDQGDGCKIMGVPARGTYGGSL